MAVREKLIDEDDAVALSLVLEKAYPSFSWNLARVTCEAALLEAKEMVTEYTVGKWKGYNYVSYS